LQKGFNVLTGSEIVDAVFFDIDNDNDEDLYVVTGGYEFEPGDKALNDFLFENRNGDFITKQLPLLPVSGLIAMVTSICSLAVGFFPVTTPRLPRAIF
jgi:hypothetical protein